MIIYNSLQFSMIIGAIKNYLMNFKEDHFKLLINFTTLVGRQSGHTAKRFEGEFGTKFTRAYKALSKKEIFSQHRPFILLN